MSTDGAVETRNSRLFTTKHTKYTKREGFYHEGTQSGANIGKVFLTTNEH
jgi:hypothetical protein